MKHYTNTFYTIFLSLIVALGGFLLGFDGVVNGGAVPFYSVTFKIVDNPLLIGLSSSAIILGGIFGNFSVGYLVDRIGRKPALLITSVLFMFGAAGTALAPNIVIFIISKIIAGLGVGIAILAAPMYIAEIAPPRKRGWLVTFNQLNIVVGLSLAMLSNYFILQHIPDPDTNWRWMLGIGFFPAVIYFFLLFLVPESPRWLIMKGRNVEGLKVLRKTCGSDEAETEYRNILQAKAMKDNQQQSSLKELFSKKMSYLLFIGFGLAIFQQLSGINAVLYYVPMIFASAGTQMDTAFLLAIVVGVVFTISTVISMVLIDRIGRRPLLIMGSVVMIISFFMVSYSFHKATYSLDGDDISKITEEAYRAKIADEAKILFPTNYLADRTEVTANVANLYSENELIGSIDLHTPNLIKAQQQTAVLRSVLTEIEGHRFEKELHFFKLIKENLGNRYTDQEQREAYARFSERYKPSILQEAIHIDTTFVLLGILGFIIGFSLSLGPVMWAMFAEIFPGRIRAIAISIVGAVNALTSFLVATIFPIELEVIGSANTYLIFGILMIFCLFFVIRFIPETKGKTLEELELDLVKA
jgi:SP family arabinose:H+ symporter-like MFS transporter